MAGCSVCRVSRGVQCNVLGWASGGFYAGVGGRTKHGREEEGLARVSNGVLDYSDYFQIAAASLTIRRRTTV